MADYDLKFIKPFIDSALNTLQVQCSLECKTGKPFVKGKDVVQPDFEIAAIIGLTSPSFTGSIAICFPKAVYLKIMSNMLMSEFTEITQDLQDGAAELLNIIFGGAKTVLNQQGYTIQKAIPTVVRGQHIQTSHLSTSPVMVIPFGTIAGEFHIEISTEAAMKQQAA